MADRVRGSYTACRAASDPLSEERAVPPHGALFLSFTSGSGNRWTPAPRPPTLPSTARSTCARNTTPTGDDASSSFPGSSVERPTRAAYDYWGVFFRLVGYEKQVIDGEQRGRLWLFFVFPINVS